MECSCRILANPRSLTGVPFRMLVPCAAGRRRCGSLRNSLVEVRGEWPADSHVEESGCRASAIGARTAAVTSLCSWDTFVSAGRATWYEGSRVLVPYSPPRASTYNLRKVSFNQKKDFFKKNMETTSECLTFPVKILYFPKCLMHFFINMKSGWITKASVKI